MSATPVFTYLANTLRRGDREIPYSLVTAIDLERLEPAIAVPAGGDLPAIVLNEWAAADCRPRPVIR